MYIHRYVQPSLQWIWEQQKPFTPHPPTPSALNNHQSPCCFFFYSLKPSGVSTLISMSPVLWSALLQVYSLLHWSHEGTEPPARKSGSPDGGWAWVRTECSRSNWTSCPRAGRPASTWNPFVEIRLQHSSFCLFVVQLFPAPSVGGFLSFIPTFHPAHLQDFSSVSTTFIREQTYNPSSGCQSIWILVIFPTMNWAQLCPWFWKNSESTLFIFTEGWILTTL